MSELHDQDAKDAERTKKPSSGSGEGVAAPQEQGKKNADAKRGTPRLCSPSHRADLSRLPHAEGTGTADTDDSSDGPVGLARLAEIHDIYGNLSEHDTAELTAIRVLLASLSSQDEALTALKAERDAAREELIREKAYAPDYISKAKRRVEELEAQLQAQDEAIADLKSENVALRENNINVKELFDGKCLGIAQAWAEIREKDEAIATLRALVETWRRVANGHYYGRDERHGMLRCADELEAAIPGQPDTSPKARRE